VTLNQWALKWGVPFEAIQDLRREMGALQTDPSPMAGKSEAAVQANERLKMTRDGGRLWRNNRGVAINEKGSHVRYGLANDTKQMNKIIKSHDLIGIKPVMITGAMVGDIIGQFTSREVKPGDWVYTGTERERAQHAWGKLIISLGGDAKFTNGN